ncbi:response regulator [Zoogloea sp.]|uniref:response regulator n=1 Tax=Zoogloea sp. TaxID=49181 RepID=UPI0035B43AF2
MPQPFLRRLPVLFAGACLGAGMAVADGGAASRSAITVVLDDKLPPYALRDGNGALQGLVPDRWRAWQAQTGVPVRLLGMDGVEAEEAMRAGTADVIDTIARSTERERRYLFSAPYARLDTMVFFQRDLSGIVDAGSSRGFVVGVKEGDPCLERLAIEGSTNVRRYRSFAALVGGVAEGQVRVFCMDERPAAYLLHQFGIADDFRHTAPMYANHFQWAVRRGDEALQRFIAAGFAAIPEEELGLINEKWFGALLEQSPPYQRYAGYGVVALVAVVLALVLWSRQLRKRVGARTEELRQALEEVRLARRDSEAARDLLEQEVVRRTAQLEAAMAEQQALFDSASVGIVLTRERRIVRGNRRLDEMFGYAPGEQIGLSSRIWYPDDEAYEQVGKAVYETLWRGGTHTWEQPAVRKDGTHFWVRMAAHVVDGGDPSRGVVGIFEDITAEREAADKLRLAYAEQQAIFEAATSGMALIVDRTLQSGNRQLHEMFGWPPGAMLGRPTRIWYADEAAWQLGGEPYAQIWRGETHSREQQLMRRDGSLFWARLTARAVDVNDRGRGSVWIIDDITAERDAIEAMRHAAEMAEEAARVKSDFLANMSHEIRTPMNAIVGMAYLTLRTELSPRQRDYLEKIQGSSQHLLGIINDILDISKIEAGKLVIERTDFELERVLDNVSSLISDRIASKGLELIVDVADDVPGSLVGDPLRLGQILVNYANNAVKFTERGEVAVRVRLAEGGQDEVLLRFEVRDTGIGLSGEQRARLFRSFEQADSSTTRKYGGTGLGLVISKRLAELMGGEVGVDSTPGVGSTFWFTARLGRSMAAARRLLPGADLRGRRMLVVDDNANAREVIGEMLRRMAFSVQAVDSGPAALAELGRAAQAGSPYEVVFLDWQMPGMDGIVTASEIGHLSLEPPPRLVMVTAYGRDELMSAAEEAGIRDVLIKPVGPSLLFDTVMRTLGSDGGLRIRPAPADQPVEPGPLRGARVLLVEDNELNQEVASEMLLQVGLQVDVADNGRVAIDKASGGHYDLILMDVQMPVMDGLTATREIRRLPACAGLPIIAMTANAMAGDRERCLQAGMNDHVAKPIDPEALWATLMRWIVLPGSAGVPAAASAGAPLREIPGLDMVAGLHHALGREVLYLSQLDKFVQGQRDFGGRLDEALQAQDWTTATRLAHTLKGGAGQIGAHELAARAADLEQALRRQDALPALAPLQAEVTAQLAVLIESIGAALPAAPAAPVVLEASVDPAAVAEVFGQLAPLLAADDFSSGQAVDAHRPLLQAVMGARFESFARAVAEFDSDRALTQLRACAAERGIPL